MQKPEKIKVVILTGFLGSGKTTLLNNILASEKDKLNFVIENEFGKVSVDSTLVQKNYNQLFELNNGCICCSLDAELIEVLTQLIKAERQPDCLYIEASGVADAGMLASVFKRDDVMKFFDLTQVICLVDAENFEDRIKEVPEMYRQVIAADRILINKSDLVQSKYISELEAKLKSLNPFAGIESIVNGQFDVNNIPKSTMSNFSKIDQFGSIETTAGHRMKSIAIAVPEAFDRDQLYAALSVTLYLHYHQVYRIKGFVKLEGEENPVLLQSTGNKVTFTSQSPIESQKYFLVFIGRDIERKGLERILSQITKKKM
ncbi:MAG: GTP-binding protein [Mongoliibacter sp.]|uniref:CobW family GTP-binding protein n=1 Tax=Mongoliibacter sp. TaxID=2022438 RepID=UPI0012F34712|nr:GTP-binding protein [Mongoliibacter sp.]TVP44968.1 MAG: GTP-binding protein [Mongoliibacter sp.]